MGKRERRAYRLYQHADKALFSGDWLVHENDLASCLAELLRQGNPSTMYINDPDGFLVKRGTAAPGTWEIPIHPRCKHCHGPIKDGGGIWLHDNKDGYYAGTQMRCDAELDDAGDVGDTT